MATVIMSAPAPAPTPIIINSSQAAPGMQAVGPKKTMVHCRGCNAQVRTKLEKKMRGKGWTICLILCCFGCWPCCLIPFCMDSSKNINHYCSNCNTYIGSYQA